MAASILVSGYSRESQRTGFGGSDSNARLLGYGADKRIRTARIVELSSDLPILVEIIDSEEYIAKLMPFLDETLEKGLVTIDDVEVIKYGKNPSV